MGSRLGSTNSTMGYLLEQVRKGSVCSTLGEGANPEVVKQLIEHQQITLEKAHSVQLRDVKAVAMQQAVEFVKKQSQEIVNTMTKEHHRMARQFLHFKGKTEGYLETIEKLQHKLTLAESALVQKTPIQEANYGLDDGSPLSLYDCLIPSVKSCFENKGDELANTFLMKMELREVKKESNYEEQQRLKV